MGSTYKIVRFYKDGKKRVIKRGVSLEQARLHCQDPTTRDVNGAWFDGFTKE